MTSLAFYGGVDEIGGNKFLLADNESRIFLDFGRNFAREKRYFDYPWIRPAKEEHLIELGILPNLPGLYRKDEEDEPSVDAVLLSHPHTDHYDSMRWLHTEIPAYMAATAETLILAREFAGRPAPSKEYAIGSWTKKEGSQVFRPLETLDLGRSTRVGGFDVAAHEVDHSTIGAVGYIVGTKDGTVVYTGDFRLHGPRATQSQTFLKAARDTEPAALVIEGTHIDESKVESEDEVGAKLKSIVREARGLVLAGFAQADLDRLSTFHSVATATDRTLILTSKQAFLVDQLGQAGQYTAFSLKSENVLVFRKEKKGTHAFEDHLEENYSDRIVSAEDVKNMQKTAILAASLSDMLALPTIEPSAGSVYVLSSSEPVDEEMEISFERLKAWLARWGLPMFQVHASGHATAHDLRNAVETVSPKKVFVVHTESSSLYARFLSGLGFETVQPLEGKAYEI